MMHRIKQVLFILGMLFTMSVYPVSADHRLAIASIEPSDPAILDEVTICTTKDNKPGSGVGIVIDSDFLTESLHPRVDEKGCAVITFSIPGTYTITARKEGYSNAVMNLVVNDIILTLSAENIAAGKSIEITVMRGKTPVAKDLVRIVKPDGSFEQSMTFDDGKISYTPDMAGLYRVQFGSKEKQFSVYNALSVIPPEGDIIEGSTVTLKVVDTDNKGVGGVDVIESTTGIEMKTDTDGDVVFTFSEPKKYSFTASKSGYEKGSIDISPLRVISIRKEPDATIHTGDSINITIVDTKGDPAKSINLFIMDPYGNRSATEPGNVTPKQVGTYRVYASCSNCKSTNTTFDVINKKMLITDEVMDSSILKILTKSEENVTLSDVNITVYIDSENSTIFKTTDKNGIAKMGLNISGVYTIYANKEGYDTLKTQIEIKKAENPNILTYALAVLIVLLAIIGVFINHRRTLIAKDVEEEE